MRQRPSIYQPQPNLELPRLLKESLQKMGFRQFMIGLEHEQDLFGPQPRRITHQWFVPPGLGFLLLFELRESFKQPGRTHAGRVSESYWTLEILLQVNIDVDDDSTWKFLNLDAMKIEFDLVTASIRDDGWAHVQRLRGGLASSSFGQRYGRFRYENAKPYKGSGYETGRERIKRLVEDVELIFWKMAPFLAESLTSPTIKAIEQDLCWICKQREINAI